MYIKWLELENFRCFEDQRIELHRECTVFFGDNGSGKTAIVDAVSQLFTTFPGMSDDFELRDADLRLVSAEAGAAYDRGRTTSAKVSMVVDLDGQELSWTLTKERGKKVVRSGHRMDKRVHRAVEEGRALPVVAVYRSSRAWKDDQPMEAQIGDQLAGYLGAFDAGTSLAGLRAWWSNQDHIRYGASAPALDAVEYAVAVATWQLVKEKDDGEAAELLRPDYDAREKDIMVPVPGQGRLALGELSDGYRNVIAIVADIARRAALLHSKPDLDLLDSATGVVVIDELDLHLHPAWQRRVLPILRRTFKGLQFIVTTHSAEVLGSAKNEQVRKLDAGTVSGEELFVEGRDSNSINVEVMRAGERDPESARLLRELLGAISSGDVQDADRRLADLRVKWGPHDADLAEAEAQLAWEREG